MGRSPSPSAPSACPPFAETACIWNVITVAPRRGRGHWAPPPRARAYHGRGHWMSDDQVPDWRRPMTAPRLSLVPPPTRRVRAAARGVPAERLHGRRLVLARVGWVTVAGVTLVLFV